MTADYISNIKKALEKAEKDYKRTGDSEYREAIKHYKQLLREAKK